MDHDEDGSGSPRQASSAGERFKSGPTQKRMPHRSEAPDHAVPLDQQRVPIASRSPPTVPTVEDEVSSDIQAGIALPLTYPPPSKHPLPDAGYSESDESFPPVHARRQRHSDRPRSPSHTPRRSMPDNADTDPGTETNYEESFGYPAPTRPFHRHDDMDDRIVELTAEYEELLRKKDLEHEEKIKRVNRHRDEDMERQLAEERALSKERTFQQDKIYQSELKQQEDHASKLNKAAQDRLQGENASLNQRIKENATAFAAEIERLNTQHRAATEELKRIAEANMEEVCRDYVEKMKDLQKEKQDLVEELRQKERFCRETRGQEEALMRLKDEFATFKEEANKQSLNYLAKLNAQKAELRCLSDQLNEKEVTMAEQKAAHIEALQREKRKSRDLDQEAEARGRREEQEKYYQNERQRREDEATWKRNFLDRQANGQLELENQTLKKENERLKLEIGITKFEKTHPRAAPRTKLFPSSTKITLCWRHGEADLQVELYASCCDWKRRPLQFRQGRNGENDMYVALIECYVGEIIQYYFRIDGEIKLHVNELHVDTIEEEIDGDIVRVNTHRVT